MDKNREFAKLAGICWHEWVDNLGHDGGIICKHCWKNPDEVSNPDFTDAREVLKVMELRRDWVGFLNFIHGGKLWNGELHASVVPLWLVKNTTGKLRDLAIEWLEKEEGK